MGLKEQITADLKEAMRAKDKTRLDAVRALRGEVLKIEKSGKGGDATDDAILKKLKSLIKQRKDSIEQFTKGGREDLVAQEKAQLEILERYLPAQLDEAELVPMIEATIAEIGAETVKDMGKVMGAMQGKIKATGKDADNRFVAQMIKAKLS